MHFYFKFRLRHLRDCLWQATPIEWEVTSKEQNTQDKFAQATAPPEHSYSCLIQQPCNNSKQFDPPTLEGIQMPLLFQAALLS